MSKEQEKTSVSNNPNGRPKGSMNKRTRLLADLADSHNADPALFLIHVMTGNRQALSLKYLDEESGEEVVNSPLIEFEARIEAAKELMPYLYGKRKPIDSDGNDKGDPLTDLINALRPQ